LKPEILAVPDRHGRDLEQKVHDETTWVSFRRHSSFRRKAEALEGIAGGAEYAGPLKEFLTLLCMGQLTHLGIRVVFGLGRYKIAET
jgi:hypothetical protein